MDGRRARYAPLSVEAPWSQTTQKLRDQFGWDGVVCWHFMILAAKRNRDPGEFSYTSDRDFWVALGMEEQVPEFTPDAILTTLGRLKQTRKRRDGRKLHVEVTKFGDWNNTDKRWNEAEKKRRSRRKNRGDTKRTPPGQSRDTQGDTAGTMLQEALSTTPTTTNEVLPVVPSVVKNSVPLRSSGSGDGFEITEEEARQRIDELAGSIGREL